MRAAVLGSPIGHSLSPALHRAAYTALGLAWTYDPIELLPADLPAFLAGLDDQWAGLSLTMPLKQTVLPLLHEASELVRITGAANTVVLTGSERRGHNTDVAGIVVALREAGLASPRRGAVLGAGATAASALAALAELGCSQVCVYARSLERAAGLRAVAEHLDLTLQIAVLTADLVDPGCDVVVNTTPAGALDEVVSRARPLEGSPMLLDVVYHPWPTPLAALFTGAGATVVPGLAMLLHQAAAQVELMTGRPAPLAAMRAALPA